MVEKMETSYFAKSHPVETIAEHTRKVCEVMERFRELYPNVLDEKGWLKLYYACTYHDFGKHDAAFQNRIRRALRLPPIADKRAKDEPELPHGALSPCALPIEEMRSRGLDNQDIIDVCAAIFFHHERESLPKDSKDAMKIIDVFLAPIVKESFGREPFRDYLFIGKEWRNFNSQGGLDCLRREYIMLHGLLNRMDYAASAGLAEAEQETADFGGLTYTERTDKFFSIRGYRKNKMQEYLARKKGVSIAIIAATGSGKTEGALLWGDGGKLFYTLPVRTAINSMYERIKRGSIAYGKTAILHSDAFSQYISEDESTAYAAYNAARQFSAPLTICTVDQLFKFVFFGAGAECRLATLAYSNVVIDEIQSYSPEIIACLIYGAQKVIEMGGRVLIMTATLPKIVYMEFLMRALGTDEKLPLVFHTDITKRHRIRYRAENELPAKEMLDAAKTKRVLVIRNTVKAAQKTYDTLREAGASPGMLHSRFTRIDRAKHEREILEFAPNENGRAEKHGIWVCTQVVEASLDVDFDVLYTDMCAIESLLQRMGRVYRSRNIDHDGFNVFVFDTRIGVGVDGRSVIERDIYDYSVRAVKAVDGELLEESDDCDLKQKMMDIVYDPERNADIALSDYVRKIREKLRFLRETPPHGLKNAEIDVQFRNMKTKNVIPRSLVNDLRESGRIKAWKAEYEAAELENNRTRIRKLWDEIASYTISAPIYIESSKSAFEVFHKNEDFEVTECEYDRSMGLIVMSEADVEKKTQMNFF